jgi:hypothetical protein
MPDHKQQYDELLKNLIEQKMISAPQADIARSDAAVTGMALDEVLIARRWVTEEALHTLAPWLKQIGVVQPAPQSQEAFDIDPSQSQSSDDFDENLEKYRSLMENILGEANK